MYTLRRLSVALLLIGLVSMAVAAKYSFELPRSSQSHWVSQACKTEVRPGRRAPTLRLADVHRHRRQSSVAVIADAGATALRAPDFFGHTAPRSPPSFC
jgi:hypothetical protein